MSDLFVDYFTFARMSESQQAHIRYALESRDLPLDHVQCIVIDEDTGDYVGAVIYPNGKVEMVESEDGTLMRLNVEILGDVERVRALYGENDWVPKWV